VGGGGDVIRIVGRQTGAEEEGRHAPVGLKSSALGTRL
jgi:hypothetical protein